MAEEENKSNNEGSQQEELPKEKTLEELQRENYLDPEGGYQDPIKGLEAEKIAMMSAPPLNVQALPTKLYLDKTVNPTVLKAL